MPISQTPPIEMFPLRASEELPPSVSRFAPLPTPTALKKKKLFGIPLTSALTGETVDDEVIQDYINRAVSELEHLLDLYITPVEFEERHDYEREIFAWSHAYLKLNHPNVITVKNVSISFYNSKDPKGFVDFPKEHIFVMPQEAVIQLVPAFGTSLSGFLLSAFSGAQYHALRATGVTNFPGAIYVKYVAGFEHDKVPALLVDLIEINAAMQILSMLGPVLFPYNSISIGIDGTSQSTGGPGTKFLADRLEQLKEEWEKKLDAAKGYYQRRWLIDAI